MIFLVLFWIGEMRDQADEFFVSIDSLRLRIGA